MLAIVLIVIGVVSRLVLHLPNFTPVIALALFGGAYLHRRTALVVPIALMAASDLFLGWHDTILFTWGSMALIALVGRSLKSHKSILTVTAYSCVSAVLFFVVTNLGSWLVMYPMTWAGLADCFIAAVPFFRMTLISTLVYSAVLFGGYELLVNPVRKTRWNKFLLSKI